ncbi:MAG: hypothetical protein ACI8RD_000344 [Bacillariaceae sp.]|jgi:hypothetical protein
MYSFFSKGTKEHHTLSTCPLLICDLYFLFRMISTGISLRYSSSRSYYFCWLPLLRFCLTTPDYHGYHHLHSATFCRAFTPPTRTAKSKNYFTTTSISSSVATRRTGSTVILPFAMARTTSRSLRGTSSSALSNDGDSDATDADVLPTAAIKKSPRKKSPRKRAIKKKVEDDDDASTSKTSPKKKSKTVVKKKSTTANKKKKIDSVKGGKKEESKKKKSPSKKAADHQRITEIDKLPKLWDKEKAKANGSYSKY